MIWFTSDTHFGHINIIKYSNRPFKSVEEMDNVLINNWNSVVKKKDTIYHLGDFCVGNEKDYLSKLNGAVFFIKGSHDKWMTGPYYPYMVDLKLDEYNDEVNTNKSKHLILCHYSLRSWPLSHYASWHLFGHHHGNLEPYGLSFDIGVDCHNFFPISIDEVAERMAKLKPIVDYRSNYDSKN